MSQWMPDRPNISSRVGNETSKIFKLCRENISVNIFVTVQYLKTAKMWSPSNLLVLVMSNTNILGISKVKVSSQIK